MNMRPRIKDIPMMSYGITIKRNSVWTRLTIVRNEELFLSGNAQYRVHTKNKIYFSCSNNERTWFAKIPKPLRALILQKMNTLQKNQTWTSGKLVGQYIPWIDNPSVNKSSTQGKLKHVSTVMPDYIRDLPAQLDLGFT